MARRPPRNNEDGKAPPITAHNPISHTFIPFLRSFLAFERKKKEKESDFATNPVRKKAAAAWDYTHILFFSFACLSSLLSFVQDRFSRPFFRELDLFFQKSGLDFSLGAGLAFSRQGLLSGVFHNAYNFMAQKSEDRGKSAFSKKNPDYVFPIFSGTPNAGGTFCTLFFFLSSADAASKRCQTN